MNILKLLFQLLLLYLAYKFIFHFIIPVYRTTKQMRRKMNEMQETMQQQYRQQQQYQQQQYQQQPQATVKEESRPAAEDYIEFEEVK